MILPYRKHELELSFLYFVFLLARSLLRGGLLNNNFKIMCDASLRDLVAFVQFKKCEKHPWRSDTYSKTAGQSLQLY